MLTIKMRGWKDNKEYSVVRVGGLLITKTYKFCYLSLKYFTVKRKVFNLILE